jgi:hypothetical protein
MVARLHEDIAPLRRGEDAQPEHERKDKQDARRQPEYKTHR